MNNAQFVFEKATSQPEKVTEILVKMHKQGETVTEILDFIDEAQKRMVSVKIPPNSALARKKIFDVCGTGGSGKTRINLSTALAIQLSEDFTIAKHGNKASSGKVGSFDLIEKVNLTPSITPQDVLQNLNEHHLAFIFAPAFHPALKPLAAIRKAIPHPTVFNYLGPLLNPVENLTAQMTGVSSIEVGDKLAAVAAVLNRNILFVHDTKFGLDDVSIGGATKFWAVGLEKNKIHSGTFFPEDYGFSSVSDFSAITGGDISDNEALFQALLNGIAPKPYLDFLAINKQVATEFFKSFR